MDFLKLGLSPCDIYQPSVHNHELLWVAFIAWLADHRNIRMTTGRHYLFGIQSLLVEAGHHVPILRFKLVRRALKAWGKREGPTTTHSKLPVTVAVLRASVSSFSKRHHEDRVIWAMATLGVYGLLRCGEMTVDSFEPSRYPRFSDWSLHEHGTVGRFRLPTSKSDVLHQGTYIYVGVNASETCPVTAMRSMILLAPFMWTTASPLFSFNGIHPVTRSAFLKKVRNHFNATLPSSTVSGHSFRRGGAQSLYDAGVPLETIRDIGRWKSDLVMRRYYGFSVEKLRSISASAATAAPSRLLNFHLLRAPTPGT